jgi:hypothetical protein
MDGRNPLRKLSKTCSPMTSWLTTKLNPYKRRKASGKSESREKKASEAARLAHPLWRNAFARSMRNRKDCTNTA